MPRGYTNSRPDAVPSDAPVATPDAPDVVTGPATTPDVPLPVPDVPVPDVPVKPETAEAKAKRMKAQALAAKAEADAAQLDSAPTYVVAHPAGYSRRVSVPGAEFTLTDGSVVWVDAVPDRIDKDPKNPADEGTPTAEGYIAVPQYARIRAESVKELGLLQLLATQGFMQAVT